VLQDHRRHDALKKNTVQRRSTIMSSTMLKRSKNARNYCTSSSNVISSTMKSTPREHSDSSLSEAIVVVDALKDTNLLSFFLIQLPQAA